MSREKIEEIAKDLDECPYIANPIGTDKHEGNIKIADYLVNKKGYRKQSEGQWIIKKGGYYQSFICSVCEHLSIAPFDYCPYCGAKVKVAD